MTDFTMINEIDILEHSQSCDFSSCPGKKSGSLLCVVSYHHELVVELGEDSFNPFAEHILGNINGNSHVLSDFFAKSRGQFTTLIVLTTGNQVGQSISFLCNKTFDQIVFTV